MPFNEAKQIVEKQVAPKIKERGIQMNVAYKMLLGKFDKHTKKASKYLVHANYPGHNQDKQNYLAQIRKSTDGFLKSKGELKEFFQYSTKLNIQSHKLHETIGKGIKQREKAKYEELSKKNISLVRKANFDDAISNMLTLHTHLSPFSRTDKSGNIGEAYLRIDKKIEEKVNKLKGQKNLHSQLFVKGNVFETKGAKILIQGISGEGQVKYADIKGKKISELKPGDYKSSSWLAILRKFPPGKFELKKGEKKIDIKTDPKLAESKGQIAELKLLKQINFFYSGGLEKFAKSPEEKKLLKNALEENLATMGLYFDRNIDGTVTPTKIYKMLPQAMKAKKLIGMIQGFQRIRMRMSLEKQEKKETNPNKVRFLKAEIDYQNGLHLSAYTKFKKYIKDNKGNSDEAVKKQVKHAKGRLRQSSFYVISLAQRYSMACIQEPNGNKQKFHLRNGFRKKIIKKLTKVFNQLRKSMQSGKAADLDQAYAQLKDKPEGGLDVKMEEFGGKGITERNFLENHYSFVKTMITSVTFISDNERQEDGLTALGDEARKDKFRGGARVLYEEQMKRRLIMRRRKLMKDPKYRKNIRDRFVRLKLDSERKALSSTQVAKLLAKELLDSNKTHAQSRSFLDDLKTLKQFEEKNIGFIDKAKKGATTALDISSGHSKSIKRILDTLDIPGKNVNEKLSKYEDFNPFAKTAGIYRRAAHEAGGLNKYMKLPLEKKKELFEAAKIKILLDQHENIEHTINVHAYVKQEMAGDKEMTQRTNPVVYKYNDAYDPNNEFFNLSDEGWDFVESLVGEIPIMAASGGVGNVAALGVKQGAKYAVKKLAQTAFKRTLQSAAFRLGVRGTAFVADLAVSEVVDRGMRYILRGEDPPTDIAQLLAHSLGTYGSMKYASKGGQRLLKGVAKKGMVGKIASHAISTAAIEAPCMMAVNTLFGQTEGSILEQYGRALATMLASKGSMSMLHRSTGGAMMRAEQNYDIKDSVNNIPNPQKRNLLNKMVSKGEISVDQLGVIMSGNLNYKQIKQIRGRINNPKSVKFLLAYKYAESHGVENRELTLQYDYLVYQLRGAGLSRADTDMLLKGIKDNINARRNKEGAKAPAAKPVEASPNEFDKTKLDKLNTRLKKLGFDDLAYIIADTNIERIPVKFQDGGGKVIKTYKQRLKIVNRLAELNSKIKLETDFLREKGLNKEATELENYQNTSKYKSLEHRFQASLNLRIGLETLIRLKIPYNAESAAKIINFLNARTDDGRTFQEAIVRKIKAEFNNETDSQRMLDKEIDRILVQVFGKVSPALKAKILDFANKKLMSLEDRDIMESNKKRMTPEMMHAIILGGESFTVGGKTVRIFKGKHLGAGGLATVNNVWYVEKPSNKLQHGVVKVPHEHAQVHFKYESEVAGDLARVLSENPTERMIKPIFASPEIIIYKKIEHKGKSQHLIDAFSTLSTKDWLLQFAGGVEGLAYLHKNGITHNDFKPDNIVVGKNGGVLIDIGSFVLDKDAGTKVVSLMSESGKKAAFFKVDGDTASICYTASFHKPEILAKSIEARKKDPNVPLNSGDKYAVGTSLLTMLVQKGYVNKPKDPNNHTFNLNKGAPDSVNKLYNLGIQLMAAPKHPYKYKRNKQKQGKDPGYISLDNAVVKIKKLASTMPAKDPTPTKPPRDAEPTQPATPTKPPRDAEPTVPLKSKKPEK